MRRRVGKNACWFALAGAGVALCAWLGLKSFAWSDYETEARPAFEALVHGDALAFLRLSPAYGGSLVLRAPFALLPGLWGGGSLAVYRAVAAPCLLAAAALGVWLAVRARRDGQTRLVAAVALLLCAANPIAIYALEYGHPEDLLCATFALAAVLCACSDRPLWTGALVGLAFATKAWGLVALAPALAALSCHRPRALASAAACAVLVLAPLTLARSHASLASSGAAAANTGTLFTPWQAWWWLGPDARSVHNAAGQTLTGYRAAPALVARIAHPLIVLLPIPLALLWLLRGRRRERADALALLALALLARGLLDPWDNVYYLLPFVLALTAWETVARRRAPLLGLLASMLTLLSFELAPSYLSPDGQAMLFAAWTVPLAGLLATVLYGAPAARLRLASALARPSVRRQSAAPGAGS
ncbi:MAG TPA: glycosyltransferase 87 family protein [Solirubrobacteraceae bacterium]|nr:glycosyltransferase 87 family protein [Solirubrobacteraceae bacterium]